MVRIFAVIATVMFSLTVAVADERVEKPFDIVGTYHCTGKDKAGEQYSCVAVIQKANELYVVRWMIGDTVTMGVGMRIADELVVGWTPMQMKDGKPAAIGVTRYRIEQGRLTGRWAALPSGGAVGDESLEWLKGAE